MPALHSGLKQDHVHEGLPGLGSPHLVGLEGGYYGGHQLENKESSRVVFVSLPHDAKNACKYLLNEHSKLQYCRPIQGAAL